MATNSGLLDMSLDDIIVKNKPQRGKRGGGGGAMRTSRRSGRDDRARPYANSSLRPTAATNISDKIVVSNLAKSVTQNDVHELFSQIGPIRSAQLNYDAQGRSKGVANVIFSRPKDAQAAIREYHNRTLDNKPMKIELIVRADAAPALTPSAAPRRSTGGRLGRTGPSAGGGHRGNRGRVNASGVHKKVPKTADELDAEMEAYMQDEAMEVDAQLAQSNTSANGINLNLANALNGSS
ncbi:hypothetical protein SpCBS45565_g07238 [Spizellomyces sp. 'palustris']|nr:hypothetical protein SpCBS45565_g07238 [Spizellomyces sp. 'palustris']